MKPSTLPAPTTVMNTATTAASVVFTTWAVADLATIPTTGAAPLAIAITAGLAVEGLWLSLLATEWAQARRTGHVSTPLSTVGWVLAVAASAVIVVHGLITFPILAILAILPLGAKAGWFFRTRDRAAQTREDLARKKEERRRAEALSTDPTEKEQQALAERARRLEVRRQEMELAEAEADLKHTAEINAIERKGRAELARARAYFTVAKEVQQNDREIGYQQAPAVLALGSGSFAPDDASALGAPGGGDTGMGFASAMAQARMQTPTVRTGSDQEVPGVPGKAPTPTVQTREHPSVVEARRNRAACGQAFQELLEELGEVPSIAAVAGAAGVSDRAAGRHLRALGLIPPASKSTG